MRVLGIEFDMVDGQRARLLLEQWAEAGCFRHVVTANAELVMRARSDPAVAGVLARADLVVADGVGVVWASRVLQPPGLPARLPGVELVPWLLGRAAESRFPVYLLGARPEVLERLLCRLRAAYPHLPIAGAHHGYFQDEEEVAAAVGRARARIVLVGLGQPRQEQFIAKYGPTWHGAVAMGVGGTFDVLAGAVPRAPAWMRARGLEWLYRLAREPRRWRRQLALPLFAGRVLYERAGMALRNRRS